MFKMRCHVCGGTHTKKNGVRKGVQLYKCLDCGYQFRAGIEVSEDELLDAIPHLYSRLFINHPKIRHKVTQYSRKFLLQN